VIFLPSFFPKRHRNCVPQSRLSYQPLFVHTNQHWDGYIGVVVNLRQAAKKGSNRFICST